MRPNALFIVGPTACGKSDFACAVAAESTKRIEIINCDSVQFYQGVEIGSAKPTPQMRASVEHHLVGHVAAGASYTAGDFRRDATAILESTPPGRNFLMVGGSGFYIQALEKGMYDVPEVSEEIREALNDESGTEAGVLRLYEELKSRDAEAAARIHVADRYRIVRSLEILRAHPGTLTEIRAQFAVSTGKSAPFFSRKIGLRVSREKLRRRVETRTRQMLEFGMVEEVRALRDKGLGDWAPLKSVGYREVQAHLDGHLRASELEAAIITSTMQLAKKQMTWFKRDTSIDWFDVDKGWADPLERARSFIET